MIRKIAGVARAGTCPDGAIRDGASPGLDLDPRHETEAGGFFIALVSSISARLNPRSPAGRHKIEPPFRSHGRLIRSNQPEEKKLAQTQDHEMVSIYPFSDEEVDQLMNHSNECVLMWATKDGWPVGVTHAFLWHAGKIWLTFGAHRHRTDRKSVV